MSSGLPIIPGPPDFPIDLPAIEAALAGVVSAAELAATPQDAGFHAEGDVWIHTRMVLDALVADRDWRALPAAEPASQAPPGPVLRVRP